MSETVKGIAEAIEKALQSAWKFGAALVLIGLAIHAGIYLNYIDRAALSNQIATYASISVAVGGALLAAAIIFWIFEWFLSLKDAWVDHKETAQANERSLQNIRYAPDSSLLILWIALHEPNGRMPSIGAIPSLTRLRDLGIIAPEDVWKGVDEGALISVNRSIYKRKDDILAVIRRRRTDLNLDNDSEIRAALQQIIRSERGW